MKLAIISAAAALVLTTAASALTPAPNFDASDIDGSFSQITTGEQVNVSVADYVRDRAQIDHVDNTLSITAFDRAPRAKTNVDFQ